jgi:hypothetical protein
MGKVFVHETPSPPDQDDRPRVGDALIVIIATTMSGAIVGCGRAG